MIIGSLHWEVGVGFNSLLIMIRILTTLVLLITIVSCSPYRQISDNHKSSADSLSIVTTHDTTHLVIHDTIYDHQSTHIITRDTTHITERIHITYDPSTGNPISRTEDRDITSIHTLDSLALRIKQLEHSLDSLRISDSTTIAATSTDSISNSITTERGDAARTTWQTFLHYLTKLSSFICLMIIVALSFFAFIKFRK